METVTLPKEEYDEMKRELKTLKNTALYKRLLEFEENIKSERFTRKDIAL